MFRCVNGELIIPPAWEELRGLLADRDAGVVYVLGPTDTGKSTLCRYLIGKLAGSEPAAYLDADTGQSTVGPPSTVGLAVCAGKPARLTQTYLRFVGSTSPQGHMLQHLVSTARLLEIARGQGIHPVIIDSPGWVEGLAAGEFQTRMIDLLNPDLVVAIQEGNELDGILANFRSRSGMTLRSIVPSPQVQRRSRAWRARYRQERYRTYFSGHIYIGIPLSGTGFHGKIPDSFRNEDWKNLLVALCDKDMLLVSLAIVEKLDLEEGVLHIRSPPVDLSRVASVQVGSIRLEPEHASIPGSRHPQV
jgi:polynucleotide 5'-hydroxyl-kinase GRC3/NOL9